MKILESKIFSGFKTMAFAVIVLGAYVLVSNTFAQTWSAPTQNPPSSNIATPINTLNFGQTKTGYLSLHTSNDVTNAPYGLIIPYGKVGIGTITPGEALEVAGNMRANELHTDQICNRAVTPVCVSFSTLYNLIAPTIPTIPIAPTGLSASPASTSSINLSWAFAPSATSYKIYRSSTNSRFTTAVASNVTGTNYTDSGLSASTLYYYVVSAVNTAGEGPKSSSAFATTNAVSSGGGGGGSAPAVLNISFSVVKYINSDGKQAIAVSASASSGACILKHRATIVGSSPRNWIPLSGSLPGCPTSVTANDNIVYTGVNGASFYQGPGTYTMEYEVYDWTSYGVRSQTFTIN